MHRLRLALAALTTLALFPACGPDLATIEETAELDTVEGELCSAKDVDGLTEGSPEALGVLKVANQADLATLTNGVRLAKKTASNVLSRRNGPDGVLGTSDDKPFTSLKDLSSVCGVGSSAIHSLLLWAMAHGDVVAAVDAGQPTVDAGSPVAPVDAGTPAVDVGPLSPCVGGLSPTDLQGLYGATWLSPRFAKWTRTCRENAGVKSCDPWVKGLIDDAASVYSSNKLATVNDWTLKVDATSSGPSIALANTHGSAYWGKGQVGATAGSATALTVTVTYRGYTNVCDDYSYGGGWGSGGCMRSHYDYWDATWLTMTGTVSRTCVAVADPIATSNLVTFGPGVTTYTESVRTLSTAP